METSPLICSENHWTGSYMIRASVMKELNSGSGSIKFISFLRVV